MHGKVVDPNTSSFNKEAFDQLQNQLNSIKGPSTPVNFTSLEENKNQEGLDAAKALAKVSPQSVKNLEYKYKTATIQLPSEGSIYPPENPWCGIKEATIHKITLDEEDILFSEKIITKGLVVDRLLQSVLMNKLSADDLLNGDRMAVLIALRSLSFGSKYNPGTKINCEFCDFQFECEFELDKLNIRKTSDIPELKNGGNNFEIRINQDLIVSVKFFTNKDEAIVEEQIKADRKFTQSDVDKSASIRLFNQIVAINGNTDRNYIREQLRLGLIDSEGSRIIRKFINEKQPTILLEQGVECPNCRAEFKERVSITREFLYPKL